MCIVSLAEGAFFGTFSYENMMYSSSFHPPHTSLQFPDRYVGYLDNRAMKGAAIPTTHTTLPIKIYMK
jgi:hypothetical protein